MGSAGIFGLSAFLFLSQPTCSSVGQCSLASQLSSMIASMPLGRLCCTGTTALPAVIALWAASLRFLTVEPSSLGVIATLLCSAALARTATTFGVAFCADSCLTAVSFTTVLTVGVGAAVRPSGPLCSASHGDEAHNPNSACNPKASSAANADACACCSARAVLCSASASSTWLSCTNEAHSPPGSTWSLFSVNGTSWRLTSSRVTTPLMAMSEMQHFKMCPMTPAWKAFPMTLYLSRMCRPST